MVLQFMICRPWSSSIRKSQVHLRNLMKKDYFTQRRQKT
uniref:Uncharacterized protein n=1 Tax=Arundo donax TaxID=35708 RepID=A0A0A9DGN5_ARUDO